MDTPNLAKLILLLLAIALLGSTLSSCGKETTTNDTNHVSWTLSRYYEPIMTDDSIALQIALAPKTMRFRL